MTVGTPRDDDIATDARSPGAAPPRSEPEPTSDAEGPVSTTFARRDPTVVSRALEAWFPSVLGDVDQVELRDLTTPSGSGFSNETYLFDLAWRAPAGHQRQRFAVQAAPIGDALFQRYDLEKMFLLQRRLGQSGIPTARMRWFESDPAILGADFYVMDFTPGRVPTDHPSYHAEGFVAEASAEVRETLWWSGVEAMARVHRIDPGPLGLDLGPTNDPVGHRLDFWEQFVRWATRDRLPFFEESIRWLRQNRPHPSAPLSVTWGDAKLGNIIFDEGRCAAMLDWELCGVGYAEEDLAHWLWMDHYASAAHGVPRLAGLPGAEETIDRYRGFLGREVEALGWWYFYSALRLSVICHRIMHQLRSLGGLPPDTDVGSVNPVTGLLRELLEERA